VQHTRSLARRHFFESRKRADTSIDPLDPGDLALLSLSPTGRGYRRHASLLEEIGHDGNLMESAVLGSPGPQILSPNIAKFKPASSSWSWDSQISLLEMRHQNCRIQYPRQDLVSIDLVTEQPFNDCLTVPEDTGVPSPVLCRRNGQTLPARPNDNW